MVNGRARQSGNQSDADGLDPAVEIRFRSAKVNIPAVYLRAGKTCHNIEA